MQQQQRQQRQQRQQQGGVCRPPKPRTPATDLLLAARPLPQLQRLLQRLPHRRGPQLEAGAVVPPVDEVHHRRLHKRPLVPPLASGGQGGLQPWQAYHCTIRSSTPVLPSSPPAPPCLGPGRHRRRHSACCLSPRPGPAGGART
jgi:hypothetical protein